MAQLEKNAKRFRITRSMNHVGYRLAVMLKSVGIVPQKDQIIAYLGDQDKLVKDLTDAEIEQSLIEDIGKFLAEMKLTFGEYKTFREKIDSTDNIASLNNEYIEMLHAWFKRKLVFIDDPHASGNEIVATICRNTPPGSLNTIVGMQNIKGTGLDFVYRWQAWEKCHLACQELMSEESGTVENGLKELIAFQEHGPLSDETVIETLEKVRHSVISQSERFQAGLEMISSKRKVAALSASHISETKVKSGLFVWLLESIEQFFDAGDAVSRRKKADKIYSELVAGRISQALAAVKLQELNKRQKGGWLIKSYEDLRESLPLKLRGRSQ